MKKSPVVFTLAALAVFLGSSSEGAESRTNEINYRSEIVAVSNDGGETTVTTTDDHGIHLVVPSDDPSLLQIPWMAQEASPGTTTTVQDQCTLPNNQLMTNPFDKPAPKFRNIDPAPPHEGTSSTVSEN